MSSLTIIIGALGDVTLLVIGRRKLIRKKRKEAATK